MSIPCNSCDNLHLALKSIMVNKCVVPGCRSGYRGNEKPEGVTTHIFPNSQEQRAKWIKAIPRAD